MMKIDGFGALPVRYADANAPYEFISFAKERLAGPCPACGHAGAAVESF